MATKPKRSFTAEQKAAEQSGKSVSQVVRELELTANDPDSLD
jgi:hypothetical protein